MDRESQREKKRKTIRCSVAKYVKNFWSKIHFYIFSKINFISILQMFFTNFMFFSVQDRGWLDKMYKFLDGGL